MSIVFATGYGPNYSHLGFSSGGYMQPPQVNNPLFKADPTMLKYSDLMTYKGISFFKSI